MLRKTVEFLGQEAVIRIDHEGALVNETNGAIIVTPEEMDEFVAWIGQEHVKYKRQFVDVDEDGA
jgi:hypothetical protein